MGLQDKLSSITQTREVGKLLADITEILDKLEGINCYIERSGNRWKINASPASLPEGGLQYQVLQRDSGGVAVWDYVRAAPDPA